MQGRTDLLLLKLEISKLLSLLASDKEVKSLCKSICSSAIEHIHVGGLIGSSAPLLFASVAQMMEGKDGLPLLVFVLDDADSAGYFYHDLVQMLDDQKVLFFPSSYKRAIKYNQKDAGNEILRTEVLSRMAQNERLLVVTYPDALAEKVVSQKKLEANTIVLNKGGMYDVNDLEKRMLALGFVRKDYVYEPGQFAVRGSIVDVYSFSSENPYRIDFFGDEVDSIRTFDVQTQLSVEKVDSMTVVSQMGSGESDYVAMLEFLPRETVVVSRDFAYVCDRVA